MRAVSKPTDNVMSTKAPPIAALADAAASAEIDSLQHAFERHRRAYQIFQRLLPLSDEIDNRYDPARADEVALANDAESEAMTHLIEHPVSTYEAVMLKARYLQDFDARGGLHFEQALEFLRAIRATPDPLPAPQVITHSTFEDEGDLLGTDEISHNEFASTDFEPWAHKEDEWTPPTNQEWAGLANPHLVTIRIAWIMMYKSKTELGEVAENLSNQNMLESTLERFDNTSSWLKGLHDMIESASVRLMIAGLSREGGAA